MTTGSTSGAGSVPTAAVPTTAIGTENSPGAGARRMVWLLAVAYGLTIANLYYSQPLLPQIARSFPAGPSVGNLTTAGQFGYALALVLVVPLGDIVRRRPLVCLLLVVESVALLVTATAGTVGVLLVAGTVIGLASAGVVNILVPYAATVAGDHERGRVIATMYSGGLVGVLLSRTVAGLVGGSYGWRTMFLAAAVVTLVLSVLLARVIASSPPEITIGYRAQLRATVELARAEPVLRRRAAIGASVFASFGAFWATAAFMLAAPPYQYGDAEIGLFALVGAAGALAARIAGRAADRGWQHPVTGGLLVLGVASFGALWAGSQRLTWFIVGLVLMDLATSGIHLLNMSVVYDLTRGARSRIATVYMTCYTIGGVAGAAAGTEAYRIGGWAGVAAVGATCMVIGFVCWATAPATAAPPTSTPTLTPTDGRNIRGRERGRRLR